MSVAGLVLAAGAGRRYGTPKALVRDADGTPWLARAVQALRDGGCVDVLAVLGAEAEQAQRLIPAGAQVVVAADWSEGMGASLRAGLTHPCAEEVTARLVMLVDTPDVDAAVVSRFIQAGASTKALARASYRGKPGHPVLLGRDHWPGILASIETNPDADQGARAYLRQYQPEQVECGDLASGADVDRPPPVDP